MSKFFRRSSDSSDETSSSDGLESNNGDATSPGHGGPSNGQSSALTSTLDLRNASPTSSSGLHSQMLLHSLLEERCLREAASQHPQASQEFVRVLAKTRYEQLCSALAQHNLMASTGLEAESFSAVRQSYRDGLDYLNSTKGGALQRRVHLLTNGPSSPIMDSISPAHPVLAPSRYLHEFDELSVLGKGGYGVVYHVRHRLDDREYAVKKVPISSERLRRIRQRGKAELDQLLLELRTLARLDHPNIVRYYNGWIEWANGEGGQTTGDLSSNTDGLVFSDTEDDASAGAEASHALDRVRTTSETTAESILFQHSSSASVLPSSPSAERTAELSIDLRQSTMRSSSLGGTAGVDLEIPPTEIEPALSLHLQMGLYPMTLADFISPKPTATGIVPLGHCFHLKAAINIMLALIDGVEYLHSQGIVHRDLKPANVFMAANSNPRSNRSGSVDLFLCDECRAIGAAQPVTLDVRIGDFGLVTAVADPSDTTAIVPTVGTEVYRPVRAVHGSPRFDIFSLGIIAFELVWRCDTRMERHDVLNDVRLNLRLPATFSARLGAPAAEDYGCCILEMVDPSQTGVTLQSVRQRLLEIQARAYAQSPPRADTGTFKGGV